MKAIAPIVRIVGMIAIVCCTASVVAETITLSNGEVIEGKIVEETGEYIRVLDEAGYIHKYQRLEIEEVTYPEIPSFPSQEPTQSAEQPPEQSLEQTQGAVDAVRAQMEENLKQTETMVQETLRRLYALPEYQNTFEDYKKTDADKTRGSRLQEERDRKYRKHEKYY